MSFLKKLLSVCIYFTILAPTAQAEPFMKKALNSWTGYTVDDVIESWGYPSDERIIANRHLYYWNLSSTTYIPRQTTSTVNPSFYSSTVTSTTSGGYTINNFCNKIFETDKNNKIVSWQYEGNACPKFYYTGKYLVNPQNNEWEKQKELKRMMKAEQKRLEQESKTVDSL